MTTRHRTFHAELVAALGEPGCAFCRLGSRTVSRYLDILAYENVNDVALRETIREALGPCNRHAWQFVDGTRAPLGSGIIYRDLIRTLQQRTSDDVPLGADIARRLRGLLPRGGCIACAVLTTMIRDCAHQLLQSWADRSFRAAFASSEGLCWPHLLATLDADRLARSWRELLGAQRSAWERRIAEAQRRQHSDPLWDALSSSPRMNGTQLSPTASEPTPVTPTKDVLLPPVSLGHCPVCAGVGEWLATGNELYPLALLCAVHAWHPRRPRPADEIGPLAQQLRSLEERLSHAVAVDTAGLLVIRWAERLRRGSTLPPDVTSGAGCPICGAQRSVEATLVARLDSATLCVPHLRVAAQHDSAFEKTRAATRQSWRTIEAQLDEFIRKHDYRFQSESRGEEQGSPRWAIELVAGVEGAR